MHGVQTLREQYCAKLHEVVTVNKWLKKKHEHDAEFISKGKHDHTNSSSNSDVDNKSTVSITQSCSTGSIGDADYISWLVS